MSLCDRCTNMVYKRRVEHSQTMLHELIMPDKTYYYCKALKREVPAGITKCKHFKEVKIA